MARLNRRWVKSLERAADEESMTLVCPECGAEFVVYGDFASEYMVYEWTKGTGQKGHHETPQDMLRALEHQHAPSAFVEKSSGLTFLSRQVSGMNFGAGGIEEG